MQATSIDRSAIAQTAVVSLVTFAALALLGLVLAYWTWVWLAPPPEPRAQEAVQAGGGAAGSAQAAYDLFGSRKPGGNGAAAAGTAISLLGVVAARRSRSGTEPGYAVLRLDAKQTIAVHEGRDIEPGVRLAEVHARSVVLERNGVRESLALQERIAPAAGGAPGKR